MDRDLKETDTKVKLIDLFKGEMGNYDENPIVAALVNGELRSLNSTVYTNAKIQPVRLFSYLGKRVYRKSLCLLLCYASAKLYPNRSIVIGHSLGDGFYFSYRDKKESDIDSLKKIMQKAIDENMEIGIEILSAEKAIEYTHEHNLIETEKLLQSRNDSSYVFASLDGVKEVYYEPTLPSCGLLKVWDLMEYQDGMLLRYPQMRNPESIMPFHDNPMLFSVFKQNKQIAQILNLESLGALNLKQRDNKIQDTIMLAECLQRKRIADIAVKIKERENTKVVFIAGPSSSGKTTFSLKLCNELILNGYRPIKISLDDYYLPLEQVPLDENGEKDFEVLESLDVELFRKQLSDLIEGKAVNLALYDFKQRKHFFEEKTTQLESDSILVIEGIHGLNPKLVPNLPKGLVFRIYISALTQLNLDSRSRISTTDNRILRRMIRDNRTRNLDAVETLSRWPSVERGEKMNIFPYQNNADVMINSSLEYELGVLAPYAIPLLRSVSEKDGECYATARRLLSFLELVYPIPSEDVPSDSLLREFIGGSIYNAT